MEVLCLKVPMRHPERRGISCSRLWRSFRQYRVHVPRACTGTRCAVSQAPLLLLMSLRFLNWCLDGCGSELVSALGEITQWWILTHFFYTALASLRLTSSHRQSRSPSDCIWSLHTVPNPMTARCIWLSFNRERLERWGRAGCGQFPPQV